MISDSPGKETYYRFETRAFDVLLADICGLLPSSAGLLEQLLEIPIMADVINEFLDRTTLTYMPNNLVEICVNFVKECLDCENQLNQIFEPLLGNNQ